MPYALTQDTSHLEFGDLGARANQISFQDRLLLRHTLDLSNRRKESRVNSLLGCCQALYVLRSLLECRLQASCVGIMRLLFVLQCALELVHLTVKRGHARLCEDERLLE